MIGHYEIFPFITLQCNTAKEKLQHSKWEKTNKTVEEEYMVNTFDLGVCMKAFHLVWKHPYQYSKYIIFPGLFHTKIWLYWDFDGSWTSDFWNSIKYSLQKSILKIFISPESSRRGTWTTIVWNLTK